LRKRGLRRSLLWRRRSNTSIRRRLALSLRFRRTEFGILGDLVMFISHILARNARVEEDLVDQLFNSTEKRLARVLLLLANFGKEGRPEPINAKISQETLAEMIGTTRSRVSYFMNKFRQLGFIDYNGHLEVHTSLLSVVLSEQSRVTLPQ
jgi:CRP/FNR family cyclic AMP-dependent transcriptional regulator